MSSIDGIKVRIEPIDLKKDGDEPQEDCGRGHACQFCPHDNDCKLNRDNHHRLLMQSKLARFEQIILVTANKGGVGKSTIAANLAASLAVAGHRVGVADADIHGPNQSRFFGHVGAHVKVQKDGLETCQFKHNKLKQPVAVASLAFLTPTDMTPVVWRDAYKHDFLHHLLGSFAWPELDYLVVDMPPGTGNELITLCDLLEGSEVVSLLVTSPQAVALMDTMKMATFCRERGLPMLGVVENMAGVQCPGCGEQFHLFPRDTLETALNEAQLNTLDQIPLNPTLASASDNGCPAVLEDIALAGLLKTTVETAQHWVHTRRQEINRVAMQDVIEQNIASDELKSALESLDPVVRIEAQQQLDSLLQSTAATVSDDAGLRSKWPH